VAPDRNLTSVLTTLQLQWLQLQPIEKPVQFDLKLLESVTQDADLRWRLVSITAEVIASLDARWSVIGNVQKQIDLNWPMLQSVGVTGDLRWQLLQTLEQQVQLQWGLLSGFEVTADLELQWSLVGNTNVNVTLLWLVGDAAPIPAVPGIRVMVLTDEGRVMVVPSENRVLIVN